MSLRANITAVAATLAVAAACWVIALRQMSGMDMGVATSLGSLAFFTGMWTPMMAAMMLPGATPALTRAIGVRRDPAGSGARLTGAFIAPFFLAAYLLVWTLVGLAAYAVYRPHSTALAGSLVLAAGLYELTPIKRRFRRRCRQSGRSGIVFGLDCLGSSAGLMLVLLAAGAMSPGWMAGVAAVVLVQKLAPVRALLDVPVALAILALGLAILLSPGSLPGVEPSMGAMHPAPGHATPTAPMPAHQAGTSSM